MYTTSTYFIKTQIPGATIPVLVELYRQELEYQNVKQIEVTENTIIFSKKSFSVLSIPYGNSFSNFSNGQINIEDDGVDFIVTLEADITAIFTTGGVMAGIVTIFFSIETFNAFAFIFGLIIFLLYSVASYIHTLIAFPVYFTTVRNDIERLLQSEPVQ